MNSVNELCNLLLNSPNLCDKTIKFNIQDIKLNQTSNSSLIPTSPARGKSFSFSLEKSKFPKKGNLNKNKEKAMALNFFANHELLAIEIMAMSLLKFEANDNIKRGILKTIQDEQKHFKLYTNRMNELGFEFGDFSVNDYFWKQSEHSRNMNEYLALMALTFEAANLDFALFYQHLFSKFGDTKTSKILETVYIDELSHVNFGVHWLDKFKGEKTLWNFYNELLPPLVTPQRSKGINYDRNSRLKCGLTDDFLLYLESFDDHFKITNRKNEKILES